MKATGVVRRVDDLGRIVIPKEIRRTMRIREGEPMEIFIDGGSVIFKKYSPMGSLSQAAEQLCEALARESECVCAVCDRDGVLAAGGVRLEEERPLTAAAEKGMEQRRMLSGAECDFSLWEGGPRVWALLPVISGGDLAGGLALLAGKKQPEESELRLARMAAAFLARQMED